MRVTVRTGSVVDGAVAELTIVGVDVVVGAEAEPTSVIVKDEHVAPPAPAATAPEAPS